MSVLEHQSDVPEAPVSCVNQDSVLATVYDTVSRADFSGKRVLELLPILLCSLDVSEAFGCCSDPGDRLYETATITDVACQTFLILRESVVRSCSSRAVVYVS